MSIQKCSSNDWGLAWQLITKRTGNMKILWCNNCKIDDRAVALIAPQLPLLKELCFGQNRISNEGAIVISRQLTRLRLLNISNADANSDTNQLGDEGIVAIVVSL